MPAGERDRIVDHDDEILLAARILLADLGVAPLDEQPAAAARPRQRGVVEADEGPALRQAITVQAEPRPEAGYRLGSDRGSPNHGSTLLSKRVIAQIRSPLRVMTNRPTPWLIPVEARR